MSRALPILLLTLLAPAGCELPPEERPNSEPLVVRVHQDRAPANVAVLQIEVEPTAGMVPMEELRGVARQVLIDRGYSPLAPQYVDRRVEAVAAAAVRLPEAGVLALRVGRWDDVRSGSQGLLQARVTGVFYDEAGRIVAQLGVDRTWRLLDAEYSAMTPDRRREVLVQRAFEALLEPLPAPPPL